MLIINIVIIFFFVQDTPTTEIYTYLHTLSLHDALPISAQFWVNGFRALFIRWNESSMRKMVVSFAVLAVFLLIFNWSWELFHDAHKIAQRSEEHTSELQSLMRISYAVFCLKKKTHTDYSAIYIHSYA